MRYTYLDQKQDSFLAWSTVLLSVLLVLLLLLHHSGHVIEVLYPLEALVVGIFLYRRYPVAYLGYTWWLFFLTPHFRRVVDYHSGWSEISLIMLAPYLVGGLSVCALLRSPDFLRRREYRPFGLALAGVAFGYAVGLLRSGLLSPTFDLLKWAVPVLLGLHTVLVWRDYPGLRLTLQRTFAWGVLIMGLYGIVQFFALPAWDRMWMIDSGMRSIGRPEALEVRVFSTLNSPGPFGMVMMAGVLVLFSIQNAVRNLAILPGYIGLLLSLVRSAWGGWLVGVLFMLTRVRRSLRWKLVFWLAVLVALSTVLFSTVPAIDRFVGGRFETVTRLEQDRSLNARLQFFAEIKDVAFTSPLGTGLGSAGTATKLTVGTTRAFDNGIANIPYVLGWPGGLLFAVAALLLLREAGRARTVPRDGFATAAEGVGWAVAAQLVFVNTLIDTVGILFWCFLGASIAHRLWADEQGKPGPKMKEPEGCVRSGVPRL